MFVFSTNFFEFQFFQNFKNCFKNQQKNKNIKQIIQKQKNICFLKHMKIQNFQKNMSKKNQHFPKIQKYSRKHKIKETKIQKTQKIQNVSQKTKIIRKLKKHVFFPKCPRFSIHSNRWLHRISINS